MLAWASAIGTPARLFIEQGLGPAWAPRSVTPTSLGWGRLRNPAIPAINLQLPVCEEQSDRVPKISFAWFGTRPVPVTPAIRATARTMV
jgi:hypothetical protein